MLDTEPEDFSRHFRPQSARNWIAARELGAPWTPADEERLRRMHAQGLTLDEIAGAFPDRTRDAVSSRTQKLGLSFVRSALWTDADDRAIVAGWQAGKSCVEIGAELDRHREAVNQRANKIGLRFGKRGRTRECIYGTRAHKMLADTPPSPKTTRTDFWSDAEDRQLVASWQTGSTARETAALFPQRSRDAIESRAKKIGLRFGFGKASTGRRILPDSRAAAIAAEGRK